MCRKKTSSAGFRHLRQEKLSGLKGLRTLLELHKGKEMQILSQEGLTGEVRSEAASLTSSIETWQEKRQKGQQVPQARTHKQTKNNNVYRQHVKGLTWKVGSEATDLISSSVISRLSSSNEFCAETGNVEKNLCLNPTSSACEGCIHFIQYPINSETLP